MPKRVLPFTVPEGVAAGIVLAHAVIFLLPPDTFALSINYRVMHSIAPEWVWGGAFAILSGRLRWRKVMLSVLGIVIVWMGASFFLSNVNTTIGYTLLIVGAGSLAARIGMR